MSYCSCRKLLPQPRSSMPDRYPKVSSGNPWYIGVGLAKTRYHGSFPRVPTIDKHIKWKKSGGGGRKACVKSARSDLNPSRGKGELELHSEEKRGFYRETNPCNLPARIKHRRICGPKKRGVASPQKRCLSIVRNDTLEGLPPAEKGPLKDGGRKGEEMNCAFLKWKSGCQGWNARRTRTAKRTGPKGKWKIGLEVEKTFQQLVHWVVFEHFFSQGGATYGKGKGTELLSKCALCCNVKTSRGGGVLPLKGEEGQQKGRTES